MFVTTLVLIIGLNSTHSIKVGDLFKANLSIFRFNKYILKTEWLPKFWAEMRLDYLLPQIAESHCVYLHLSFSRCEFSDDQVQQITEKWNGK
jgi:hypothetical protein